MGKKYIYLLHKKTINSNILANSPLLYLESLIHYSSFHIFFESMDTRRHWDKKKIVFYDLEMPETIHVTCTLRYNGCKRDDVVSFCKRKCMC